MKWFEQNYVIILLENLYSIIKPTLFLSNLKYCAILEEKTETKQ